MPTRRSDPHNPLAGATVVITRPSATASAMKSAARKLGASVVGLPGVALRKPADPVAAKRELIAARNSDVVVFVSPAAVQFGFAIAPKLRFARTTLVCAMGATTARALSRRGAKNIVWPRDAQTSEGLLAEPALQKLRGKRVCIIGAPGGRELLAQTLKDRKARVAHVHVYRREAPKMLARQLADLEAADTPIITLISSAETLDHLRAALPLPLFGKLAGGELVVSSLRLASLARRALFGSVHIARSPSPRDMLHAACGALAHHRL